MTFGEKLVKLRKQNALSQEQLAEKLNVSRQAVSRWELGTSPDVDNVVKIGQFFDCSLDYLLKNEITDEDIAVHGKQYLIQIVGQPPQKQKLNLLFHMFYQFLLL